MSTSPVALLPTQQSEFYKGKSKEGKSFFKVTSDFTTQRYYDWAKLAASGIKMAKIFDVIPKENQAAFKKALTNAKVIKLSRFPGRLLKRMEKAGKRFSNIWNKGISWSRTGSLFLEVNELGGSLKDGLAISKMISPSLKDNPLFHTLGGISGTSLFIGMGWKAVNSLRTIATTDLTGSKAEEGYVKVNQALLDLVKQVACVAIGILTVLTAFFGVVIASEAFAVFSAISVVFSILGYYYKNLGTEI